MFSSVTSWNVALQASLFSTISQSLLRFMSIESVMLSNHFILCHPFSLCLQSFPASVSFPINQLSVSDKVLELQLQHQFFQWIFTIDFLFLWSSCSWGNPEESFLHTFPSYRKRSLSSEHDYLESTCSRN